MANKRLEIWRNARITGLVLLNRPWTERPRVTAIGAVQLVPATYGRLDGWIDGWLGGRLVGRDGGGGGGGPQFYSQLLTQSLVPACYACRR